MNNTQEYLKSGAFYDALQENYLIYLVEYEGEYPMSFEAYEWLVRRELEQQQKELN